MSDDTPQEKQENEIEALKAIFGDDLRDLRGESAERAEWRPTEISLALFPQRGSTGNQERHCTVELRVVCPPAYPDEEPALSVGKSKGLSDLQLKSLLDDLNKISSTLRGEVMIFELAQHVQTFLHRHNKPGFKSFYEEMVTAQKQKEQMKLRDKQVKEDKERQELNERINECREIWKQEMKMTKESRQALFDEPNIEPSVVSHHLPNSIMENARRKKRSTSESSDINKCEHRGTEIFSFASRNVTRGACLGHSSRGCVVFAGLNNASGELLIIIEWKIPIQNSRASPQKHSNKTKTVSMNDQKPEYDISILMKHITSIEQELNFLIKLNHPNLVQYLSMKYSIENGKLIVHILQEFIMGSSISWYFNDHVTMDVETLRHFALGLLNAINYLHNNNIVHKNLGEKNVFIDKKGNVRLANYSLDKRLMELYLNGELNTRYSKKQDIFHVGMLLISLLKGELFSDKQNVKIPINLPQELKEFLARCTDENERTRWSADELLDHHFVKQPIARVAFQENGDQKTESDENNGNSPDAVDIESFIPTGSQSRIKNEFEILKWLGKGAFGDVLKVKNILDGGCYAIKRIELDPKNKMLNKKITREVKLLSRLNHENVVRYYNSWIESAIEQKECDNSSISTQIISKSDSFSFRNNKDLEKLAPPAVEWSVSYASRSKKGNDEEDSSESEDEDDDEDDDDMNIWKTFLTKSSSSDESVEFKADSTNESSYTAQENGHKNGRHDSVISNGAMIVQIQYLYIQMEFCEKSTLRNAIDNDLYLDSDRVWRLFREIVEGLSHIHQQGMIHRDLKPVNIFLDLNDHVKIGDFGLATNILHPAAQEVEIVSTGDIGDGSMTGHVGTALYVAPELITTGNKAIYNQKVDIYSLGIILFEMSYMALKTGMERVKILGNLRSKEIILPEEFLENCKQSTLIRWLLNHEASSRPTCTELLQCNLLPSAIEENELQEVLRQAFFNKQSKPYKYLINACFQQLSTTAESVTYDMNISKTQTTHSKHPLLMMNLVKEKVLKVFKTHGGLELTTPLLLPSCNYYDIVESSVRLMTHSGNIVHIPHDLRVPFARYVAQNNIKTIKRYSIERVYRENKNKFLCFHPRILYECSFDIVHQTNGNLFADAEVLSIMYEIVNEFSAMKTRNIAIRINHTDLLKAILMSCGINNDIFNDIYSILSDKKLTNSQIQTHLISLCLSDQTMATLFNLMQVECTIDKIGQVLKNVLRKKGGASAIAKDAIKELEIIIHHTEALGVKCPILIAPCMVYNIQQYSGMMCQFICELKKKRRKGDLDVIAAGGRYDKMLADFRKTLYVKNESSPSAVGISLSLERLVQGAMGGGDEDTFFDSCDTFVCATSSSKSATKEKAQVTSLLWSSGIQASIIDTTNIDEIQGMCRELIKAHIIIVGDSEQGTVRIRSWDKDRFQERKVPIHELVDFIQRMLVDNSGNANYPMKNDNRSSSSAIDFERVNSTPSLYVNFFSSEKSEKLAANTRRRYESQIKAQMSSFLQQLSSKVTVKVLAVSLDSTVIRSLISNLEIDAQQNIYDKAMRTIIEKHPRHKKYLMEICDEIRDYAMEKNKPIIAVYSLTDSIFKIIM